MPDISVTIHDAVHYLNARNIMIAKEREPLFPSQYIMDKLDKKLPPECQAYEKARVGFCEQFCLKGDDEKPLLVNEQYQFDAAGQTALAEALAPLLAERITITNVRKIKPEEIGNVPLTKQEVDGLAAFIDDAEPV